MTSGERRVRLPQGVAGPPPTDGIAAITTRQEAREPGARLQAVQTSAKGWQTAQVAILGLLGIVGVTRQPEQVADLPAVVQYSMATLALLAFAAAAAGALGVARVAWPLYRSVPSSDPVELEKRTREVEAAQRRLRTIVPLTVTALICMGAVFALSWWPTKPTSNLVRVDSNSGRTTCGVLVASARPYIAVKVGDQIESIELRLVDRIQPVQSCP